MRFFYVDTDPYSKEVRYCVYMTDLFYQTMGKLEARASYKSIFHRLFGLAPKEFFRFTSSHYNAKVALIPETNAIKFFFPKKDDAEKFAEEADRRMSIFY